MPLHLVHHSVYDVDVACIGNGMMAPPGGDYDSKTQSQAQQKPKRGSPMQFGSVFSPGSANSVSKLTNIFKSNKADKLGKDNGMPPNTGSMQPGLPPTPSYNGGGGVRPPSSSRVPPQGRGPSEVDLWRPQSAEERQQCMDAYDMKVMHLHIFMRSMISL